MKKNWKLLTVVFLAFGIIGCRCDCDKPKSDKPSDTAVTLYLVEDEEDRVLKGEIVSNSEIKATWDEWDKRGKNEMNITVRKDGGVVKLQVIDICQDNPVVQEVNLETNSAEIRMVKSSKSIRVDQKPHGAAYASGTRGYFTFSDQFDAKIVKDKLTNLPLFIGIEDARNYSDSRALIVPIDQVPHPYRRLRIWHEEDAGGNETIQISARSTTKIIPKTSIDISGLNQCWGWNFTRTGTGAEEDTACGNPGCP